MYEFLKAQAGAGLAPMKKRNPKIPGSVSGDRGVEDFIVYLASVCDGPRDLDKKGFSIESGPDGHLMAAKLAGGLTTRGHGHSLDSEERERAYFIAQIHAGQLKDKFGIAEYGDVMKNRKYRFAPNDSQVTRSVKFLRYNEFSRRIEFETDLPSDFDSRKQLLADLRDLRTTTGVLLSPESATLVKMAKDKKFGLVKHSFWKGDAGAGDAVSILRDIGFLADVRIAGAMRSPSSAYLSTKTSYTNVYGRKLLFAYLYHTNGRGELWNRVDEFLRAEKVKGIFSEEVETEYVGVRLQRFPFGEAVIDGIEEILQEHSVDNIDLLRRALDDESRARHQHHGLKRGVAAGEGPVLGR